MRDDVSLNGCEDDDNERICTFNLAPILSGFRSEMNFAIYAKRCAGIC